MNRPESACIIRGDQRIPLELTPTAGEFSDGYEHWAVTTRLESNDRLEVKSLHPGVVIHFTNGYMARVKLGHGDIAFFRSEAVA